MNETQLINLLKSQNVSDGQIWAVSAPTNTHKPYTVYSLIRTPLTSDLNGNCAKRLRFMFTTWADSYPQAVTILESFETALSGHGFQVGSPLIDKDPDTNAFRIINNDWSIIDDQ